MPQKTINGEDIENDSIWAEGSFIESVSVEEMKQKERTIHMKHNEEMNYITVSNVTLKQSEKKTFLVCQKCAHF